MELLGNILDSEPSGRPVAKQRSRSKQGHLSVSVRPTAGHDPGAIEIIAEVNTKDLAALEKVRDVMFAVVEEIARTGVTEQEVDRARQKVLKDRELAAADPNRTLPSNLANGPRPRRTGDFYFLNRDRQLEQVTPGAGQGGRPQVFHDQQPDRRILRADSETRADPDSGGN